MKKPTIKEVAKYANVGIGTVSSVINKSRAVSPEIVKKVEDSIRKLNYKPDSVARSMRTQRSRIIGFFINDISNIAFSTIAKGIQEELERHGLNLMLISTGDDLAEMKLIETVDAHKFDGVIASVQNENDPKLIEKLKQVKIPIALLDRDIHGVLADAVLTDFYGGIKEATEYLISLGHKEIGFISSNKDIRPGRESFKGYSDAMRLHGLEIKPEWTKRREFSVEFGIAALRELMTETKVSAVIAGSNQLLIGCMQTIKEMGISVPADLSLVGVDDSDFTRLMNPGITVVKRPLKSVGNQLAKMLVDRLSTKPVRNDTKDPAIVIYPAELVKRESCAVFAPKEERE